MNILGTRIDFLNLEESMSKIRQTIARKTKLWIVSANPELIYRAYRNRELRAMINSADLILPDGVGVLWAAKQLGLAEAERVTGIDLTLKILEEAHKKSWRVFFLGAKPGVAEKAIQNQSKKYPGITFACHHGYYKPKEEAKVLERIESFSPDILLVGLGAPKQELFNAAYQGQARVRIGVGGTIDVLAGQVKRAPQFFRTHSLEWLYRLITQPSRLGRQKVLPLYVLAVLKYKYGQKS
jgi:N-acetylglucosaminyldiphosphoundecaprenol N-acetyl-beta-D-mannosaminyltransferase